MAELTRFPPQAARYTRAQRLGAILWPSFFAAGVATMVGFALIDPLVLREIALPALPASRELIYTLGFFASWLATGSASLFTWLLLRPSAQLNAHGLKD